ncbi:hypothetical protein D9619_012562 [Psilocybe cf. subviscida]|uniref:Uncharacterized protein n=1 Tax=Psilocybe cf. subviscida TaxID=2480587 RepID=A0A8H5EZ81_9AGAR|nr:hypothetical protein D9619_012562 [Psilocybe cf. subviscida]
MAFSRLPLQYGSRTLELVLDAFRQREDRLLRLDDICGAIIGMYSDLRQYEQDLKAAVSRELANQVMSGYVDMKGDEYYELQQFRSPMENWGTLAKPIENKANKDELSNQIRIPFVPKILIQSTNCELRHSTYIRPYIWCSPQTRIAPTLEYLQDGYPPLGGFLPNKTKYCHYHL